MKLELIELPYFFIMSAVRRDGIRFNTQGDTKAYHSNSTTYLKLFKYNQ